MQRRRCHAKSRKGCITCKDRHVRCDERLPYCGNCLRLGRECLYTAGTPQGQRMDEPAVVELASIRAAAQAWMAKNSPQKYTVYYCAPHHQDVSSVAISIVQQSQEISKQRPMPRSCLLTIAQDYVPRYNYLAAQHDCVRHGLVSFASYTHFQATKSRVSKDVCIRHTDVALKKLQDDVAAFSPSNADAVITASIALAGTAQGWEQWAVFVDGYSNALSYISKHNLQTVYPNLLGDCFQLRLFSLSANPLSPPLLKDNAAMQQHVQQVLDSIMNVNTAIGIQKWRTSGFEALERLACTVHAALSLTNEIEAYHQLAWLRSWMFWIDLRRTDGGDEQLALGGHFYALVLAVVPLFPTRYSEPLINVCIKKIDAAVQEISGEIEHGFGMSKLLRSAKVWF